MAEAAVIEVRSGRGDPRAISLTPGSSLDPTSVGRAGMWRVEGAGVLDVHAYLYFDGRSLYVQSADEQTPVLVNKHQVACAWTEVRMPSTIELGQTQLVYRIDVSMYEDGDATVARDASHEADPESRTAERPLPAPRLPDAHEPRARESSPAGRRVPSSYPPPPKTAAPMRRPPPSGPQLPPVGSFGTAPAPISSPNVAARTVPIAAVPAAASSSPRSLGSSPAPMTPYDDSSSTRLQPLEDLIPQVPLPPAPGGRGGALQMPAVRPAAGTPMDGLTPNGFMPGAIPTGTAQLPSAASSSPMMMGGTPGMMPMMGAGGGAQPMMGYGAPPWNPMPQSMQATSPGVAVQPDSGATGLEKLKRDFEALPPIKRVLLVMSPFVLVAAGLLLFGDDAPPPQAAHAKAKASASAMASGSASAPSATATIASGPEMMAPVSPSPSAMGSASPTASASAPSTNAPAAVATAPSSTPSGTSAPTGSAAAADPGGASAGKDSTPAAVPAGGPLTPADLPYSATSMPMPAQRTLERQAADAWAGGSFELAAKLYDQLAQTNPGNPAFAQAARILHERLDGGVH